jgi:hypothetical protein
MPHFRASSMSLEPARSDLSGPEHGPEHSAPLDTDEDA